MSVLISVVQFTLIPPGQQADSAHGLHIDGHGVVPDEAESDDPSIVVVPGAATTTHVTVRNAGGAVGDANILCKHWHSIERALMPPLAALSPQPFVPAAGSGTAPTFAVDPPPPAVPYVADPPGGTAVGSIVRIDGTPAWNVTLPAITPANAGQWIIIKEEIGGGNAQAQTVGGNTIDTFPGPAAVKPFSVLALMSDGLSNWMSFSP